MIWLKDKKNQLWDEAYISGDLVVWTFGKTIPFIAGQWFHGKILDSGDLYPEMDSYEDKFQAMRAALNLLAG